MDAPANGRPLVIGWREYVGFPEWDLRNIRAKSDTGAKSSAIDVQNVEDIGGDRVRFEVTFSRRTKAGVRRFKVVEAPVARRTMIRSSFGSARERVIIRIPVQIGPVVKMIEMGLVSRRRMLCRVLLGRSALADDFLVDSDRAYVFGKSERRKKAVRLKQVHRRILEKKEEPLKARKKKGGSRRAEDGGV